MEGYKLLRRDRLGRRGSGVALYARECLDCLEINNGDGRVECLCVRIRGNANEVDVPVGRLNRPKRWMKCSTNSWEKSRINRITESQNHRIRESSRLEETSKII